MAIWAVILGFVLVVMAATGGAAASIWWFFLGLGIFAWGADGI